MDTTPELRVHRRSARHALSEISRFVDGTSTIPIGALHVDVNHENMNGILTPSPSPEELITRTRTRYRNPFLTHENIVHGSYSPSPSPDELVIRDRGRRKTPFTWSPKTYRCLFGTNQTSPVKGSPSKGSVPVRSGPRKKLQLLETPSPSPVKGVGGRRRAIPLSIHAEKSAVPLQTRLQALSHEQLQSVICKIVSGNPDLAMEVESSIPEPDLHAYEERLKELQKSIYGSRTRSRLTTVTDSSAYQKASVHILAFKRSVMEQSRTLFNCEQWASLLEYCMMAWQHVRDLPVWDNPPHNKPRQACFSTLVTRILDALKHATLNADNVCQLIAEFEHFMGDTKDIRGVLEFLEKKRAS